MELKITGASMTAAQDGRPLPTQEPIKPLSSSSKVTPLVRSTAVSGCVSCAASGAKSDAGCDSHLTSAATQIAQAFVEAGVMFNRADESHMALVAKALAETFKDDSGNRVVYQMPTQPNLRAQFLQNIALEQARLKAAGPK